jgi:adenylosuccinate synthase
LGVAPQKIKEIIGVTKAYCTRVGSGPFPTELFNETGDELRKIGNEFGATTGRPRRCGWMDLVALQYACMINGVSQVVMTKADVLDSFTDLKVCTSYNVNGRELKEVPFGISKVKIQPVYEDVKGWNINTTMAKHKPDLPGTMLEYVEYIEKFIGAQVKYVSNGPGRDQIVPL